MKIKSKKTYAIGTILMDYNKIKYKVVQVDRISILGKVKYGLTLKQL